MCVQVDEGRAQAFGGQLLEKLNHAMLGLMISVGHKTRLFDTMSALAPSTSQQIADAAGLQERYVREWLGAMVVGRIVDYDARQRRYQLPAEHAAFLTRAAGPNNLGSFAQYLSCFGNVEAQVVRCFTEGGGVPYSEYTDFQRLQAEESAMVHDAALLQSTVPTAGVGDRLEAGIDVLDIGCGAGHALNLMARAYPNSRFVGFDLSDEGLAAGRREAQAWNLRNVRFEAKDVVKLDGSYDLITAFDTIHDQADPAGVLAAVYKALRPSGTFLCVDIAASSNLADNMDHPLAMALYTASTMHCMTVSLARGGAGLGTMWGEELCRQMLADAGFTKVDVHRVEGDIINNYYVARK